MTPTAPIQIGSRVRVTQQIPQVGQVWSTSVEGVVERYEQRKSGSWYAHSRDDKVWLDRLDVRRDDGELVTLNLDHYSLVQTVG